MQQRAQHSLEAATDNLDGTGPVQIRQEMFPLIISN
jgi:hypothetical protein